MAPQGRCQHDDRNGDVNQPQRRSSCQAHVHILRFVGVIAGSDQTLLEGKVRSRNRMAGAAFMRYEKEAAMDWNRVEGNWKKMKGAVKQQWGKLTDDDLTQIDGSREKLEGIIQERYGIARDETRKQIDSWYQNQGLQ
jgi:uncharacterized protein YjbJ (UPF0337 family)